MNISNGEKVSRKPAEASGPGAASPRRVFLWVFFFPFVLPSPCRRSRLGGRGPGCSAAAPNVAPRAPYQHCDSNSWEQLSGGFNSSRTTEVKGEKTGNHRRLPTGSGFKRTIPPSQSVCLPQRDLRPRGIIRTGEGVFTVSQTRPAWNSEFFYLHFLSLSWN